MTRNYVELRQLANSEWAVIDCPSCCGLGLETLEGGHCKQCAGDGVMYWRKEMRAEMLCLLHAMMRGATGTSALGGRIEDLEHDLAAQRELERWRHGVTIEGDFVCPRDLECDALRREVQRLKHAPPCNCDLTCEDFSTLHKLLTYLRDKHGCEAAWKETIAALARTIRVGKAKKDGHE